MIASSAWDLPQWLFCHLGRDGRHGRGRALRD